MHVQRDMRFGRILLNDQMTSIIYCKYENSPLSTTSFSTPFYFILPCFRRLSTNWDMGWSRETLDRERGERMKGDEAIGLPLLFHTTSPYAGHRPISRPFLSLPARIYASVRQCICAPAVVRPCTVHVPLLHLGPFSPRIAWQTDKLTDDWLISG